MAETPCPLDKAKWPKLKGKCHMCGCESASANWIGFGITFEVCRRCAAEKLPEIIADTITLYPNVEEMAEDVLAKVKEAFWRGLCKRLSAERRRRDVSAGSGVSRPDTEQSQQANT